MGVILSRFRNFFENYLQHDEKQRVKNQFSLAVFQILSVGMIYFMLFNCVLRFGWIDHPDPPFNLFQ